MRVGEMYIDIGMTLTITVSEAHNKIQHTQCSTECHAGNMTSVNPH